MQPACTNDIRVARAVKREKRKIAKKLPLFAGVIQVTAKEQEIRLQRIDEECAKHKLRLEASDTRQHDCAEEMRLCAFEFLPAEAEKHQAAEQKYPHLKKPHYLADHWWRFLRDFVFPIAGREVATKFCLHFPFAEPLHNALGKCMLCKTVNPDTPATKTVTVARQYAWF